MAPIIIFDAHEEEDRLMWGEDQTCIFTVKKAYRKLCGSATHDGWPGWSHLWKIEVQQRIRTFLWILSHNKLLTNYEKWRRNLREDPCCSLCGAMEETCLHAIRDCPEAKQVWLLFVETSLQQNFFLMSLEDWLLWNTSKARGREWQSKFALVCWWNWKWRNDVVHNEMWMEIQMKVEFLRSRAQEM